MSIFPKPVPEPEEQRALGGRCPVCEVRIVTDVDDAKCSGCFEPLFYWRGRWRLERERVERRRFP